MPEFVTTANLISYEKTSSFAVFSLPAAATSDEARPRAAGAASRRKASIPRRWLRVSGTTEMPQIDQCVGHQFHTVVSLLFELEAQQQPLEFIFPREGPLHA